VRRHRWLIALIVIPLAFGGWAFGTGIEIDYGINAVIEKNKKNKKKTKKKKKKKKKVFNLCCDRGSVQGPRPSGGCKLGCDECCSCSIS
jgi:hypothetical protein